MWWWSELLLVVPFLLLLIRGILPLFIRRNPTLDFTKISRDCTVVICGLPPLLLCAGTRLFAKVRLEEKEDSAVRIYFYIQLWTIILSSWKDWILVSPSILFLSLILWSSLWPNIPVLTTQIYPTIVVFGIIRALVNILPQSNQTVSIALYRGEALTLLFWISHQVYTEDTIDMVVFTTAA